jgi:hypothetical protein
VNATRPDNCDPPSSFVAPAVANPHAPFTNTHRAPS